MTIDPTAPPGESWAYSNQNYILAGHVMERAAGIRYEELARRLIFEPLGMASASFGVDGLRGSRNHAAPHMLDVFAGQKRTGYEPHLEPWSPSGGVNASAEDMTAYIRFQLTGLAPDGTRQLDQDALREMQRTHFAGLRRERFATMPLSDPGYALGWYTAGYRGHEVLEHSGNLFGFTARVILVPAARSGVAIMTNGHHTDLFLTVAGFLLLDQLLMLHPDGELEAWVNERAHFDPLVYRARLDAVRRFEPDPDAREPFLGRYEAPGPAGGETSLVIVRHEHGLVLRVDDQFELELAPYAPDRFLGASPPALGREFRFEVDSAGAVRLLGEGQLLGVKEARVGSGAR